MRRAAMKRTALLTLAGLCPALFAGCDDEASSGADPVVFGDMAPEADATPDPEADAAPEPEADAAPDPEPGPVIAAPEALIYENDPVTDEGQLTRVVLHPVTSEDGALTSEWVEVFNCLNEEGGLTAMPDLGGFQITVSLCHEVQVARPGPEGHYDHIAPASDTDPNDSFAELMMYHHVNRVHDYFKDGFGFADLDFPLPALVNVQFKTDPPLPIPGLTPGPDGWIPFDNAAFFPKENWDLFAAQLGLPGRDSDSIIFFQGQYDFAYDGRVIYHEYTHAVVGTGRLQAPAVPDEYGLSNSSPSMNEGIADYFAASLADDPVIGAYVGGILGLGGLRNLAEPRRCPEDSIDEVHAHGLLIGSTMWAAREALGAEVTDAIAFRALEQFTPQTTHAEAGALMLAEAEAMGGDIAAQLEAIFTEHGFGVCERSAPLESWSAMGSRDGLPHVVEGLQSLGFGGYDELGVPAYKQFHLAGDAIAGAAAVRVSWRLQAGGGFGGGGGAAQLDLALRAGEPIRFDYADGVAAAFDRRLQPAADGGVQAVVLAGDCLPAAGEKLHTLFLNRGADAVQITAIEVELLDGLPADEAVELCEVE